MASRATVLETAAIYVGAVVGAGFASGREIYIFFARHGPVAPFAAAAAGVALGAVAAVFLPGAMRSRVTDYATMCDYVAGRRGRFLEAMLSIFLFAGLSVMLAAGATVIALHSTLGYTASLAVMAALTLGSILFGARGLAAVNNWLVPYLAVAVVAVAAVSISRVPGLSGLPMSGPASAPVGPVLWYLLLYIGYNFVTGAAVLVSLPPAAPGDRAAGGLIGGLSLGAMLGVAAAAIALRAPDIAHAPLPMLVLARAISPLGAALYVPAIGAAILTTAVADAYALAKRFAPARPWLAGGAAVLLAMPLANQGFVTLVDNGYPLLGLAGLLFVGLAIWRIARPKGRRR